jgi:hypothetical protein
MVDDPQGGVSVIIEEATMGAQHAQLKSKAPSVVLRPDSERSRRDRPTFRLQWRARSSSLGSAGKVRRRPRAKCARRARRPTMAWIERIGSGAWTLEREKDRKFLLPAMISRNLLHIFSY